MEEEEAYQRYVHPSFWNSETTFWLNNLFKVNNLIGAEKWKTVKKLSNKGFHVHVVESLKNLMAAVDKMLFD